MRENNHQVYIYSALDFSKLQKILLQIISKLNIQTSKKEENSIMWNGLDLWTILL